MKDLVPMVDADTAAFGDYMRAMSMPQDAPDEQDARRRAMQEGLQRAVEVPLTTMRTADRCWDAMVELGRHGNIAMRSDLEVGARALETGVWGACRNVLINLDGIEDGEFAERVRDEAEALAAHARVKLAEVLSAVAAR